MRFALAGGLLDDRLKVERTGVVTRHRGGTGQVQPQVQLVGASAKERPYADGLAEQLQASTCHAHRYQRGAPVNGAYAVALTRPSTLDDGMKSEPLASAWAGVPNHPTNRTEEPRSGSRRW